MCSYGMVPASLTHTAKVGRSTLSQLSDKATLLFPVCLRALCSVSLRLTACSVRSVLCGVVVDRRPLPCSAFFSRDSCTTSGHPRQRQLSSTQPIDAVSGVVSHLPRALSIPACAAFAVLLIGRVSCAALAPLTIGVILSAVTELNLVLVGFFAAIAAALANVLNSIYTKRAISHVACPDPIIFHMYTAATATIILLPYALLKDARDWFNGRCPQEQYDIATAP